MTKKALKEIESGIVEVSVDNETSKENVEKMAKEMGYTSQTAENNGVFVITINKTAEVKKSEEEKEENIVISIGSDKMGEGEDELGKILIKGILVKPYLKNKNFHKKTNMVIKTNAPIMPNWI